MKKVFLIGDSIRIGYDKYVKEFLKDSCEVYYPKYNCMYALHVLRMLGDWKEDLNLGDDVDVVHWNAGLWDTLELFEDGCVTPLEFYSYFIDKICLRIKLLFPKAKVIFATSTPVLEDKFTTPHVSKRQNCNVQLYNNTAKEICIKHGFYINDLYSVVEKLPREYYSDMTHLYTQEGTVALTNAVVNSICGVLNMPAKEFTLSNYQKEKSILGL